MMTSSPLLRVLLRSPPSLFPPLSSSSSIQTCEAARKSLGPTCGSLHQTCCSLHQTCGCLLRHRPSPALPAVKKNFSSTGGRRWWWTSGSLLVCGSPLLFSDWKEDNPKSELIFMAGSAVESCVKRFFENEYGQSALLCMMFGATFMYMYKTMQMRRFVFDLKHKYAACNIVVGHPTTMKRSVPGNPLIRQAGGQKGGHKM
eukprot:GHVS01018632.1.p1 GENE.GHVS01018632.1~~GHVS01018632.1.p1  ORF type:complete len:201 (+),score=54.95 GHVS01018632.1:359-961(+)